MLGANYITMILKNKKKKLKKNCLYLMCVKAEKFS